MSSLSPQLNAILRQQQRLQRAIDVRRAIANRYSWARAITFLGGFGLAAVAFYTTPLWLSFSIILLTLVLFGAAVYLHQRVSGSLRRFEEMLQRKREQVARINREWDSLPPPLQCDLRYTHPFEADLDILGHRSLHRLLDTAATQPGRERLHQWLTTTTPPTATTIQARQALIQELMPRTLLRDRLTVQGMLLSDSRTDGKENLRWQPDRLLRWLQAHQSSQALRPWVWAAALLALLNWLLLGLDLGFGLGGYWRISLLIYAALNFWHAPSIGGTFHEAGTMQAELERLLPIFRRLERLNNHTATPMLASLCAPFHAQETRPTTHLRRVARLAAATGAQGNPVVALLLNAVVPWGLYFAWQLGQEKAVLATLLPEWLERWAELETSSSLATFGALNPDSVFPVVSGADSVMSSAVPFSVQELGHPLLSNDEKIRNDFTFTQLGSVVILTGSNMAGKSTFLKALALNLLLAYAGGPVDASALSVSRFRLFTCIKVSDSVTDGISYFYAEVRRLKALLDALAPAETDDRKGISSVDGENAEPLPLFYVIDEIFRGTNNRERLEGSRAYIQALAAKAGIGLVATHDLELVQLAEEFPLITNYHFRDDILDGQMHFDYRLRPGPSPTTNALKIMHHAGLPVPMGLVDQSA